MHTNSKRKRTVVGKYSTQTDTSTSKDTIRSIQLSIELKSLNISVDIEVSCYGYEGIDAVKTALKLGLAQSTDDMIIKVSFIIL